MAKIGIFFGTFNPIHVGHLMLATYLVNNTFLDDVWFNPSPDSEFKEHKDGLIPYRYRVRFIEDSCCHFKHLEVLEIEKELPSPHYTINTLRELDKLYGGHGRNQFYPIFGADNVEKIETFHDFRSILDNYEMIVLPREGHDISHVKFTYSSAKFHEMKDAPTCNISSTFIRKQLAEGKEIRPYVPSDLIPVIMRSLQTEKEK